MYTAMKHLHLIAIALSVLLFVVRFGLMMANSQLLDKKLVKITPHVVDTVLLLTGIYLLTKLGIMPFTGESAWIDSKMTAVLAYIGLAAFTLKIAKNAWLKVFGFLGALGWVYAAYLDAVTKGLG